MRQFEEPIAAERQEGIRRTFHGLLAILRGFVKVMSPSLKGDSWFFLRVPLKAPSLCNPKPESAAFSILTTPKHPNLSTQRGLYLRNEWFRPRLAHQFLLLELLHQ